MKRFLLLLIALIMSQLGRAQNSISLGWGFPATQTLMEHLLGVKTSVKGPFTFAYRYETPINFSFGANLAYVEVTSISETVTSKFNYASLMGSADYLFIAREKLKLYSGISAGAAYRYNGICADFLPALHLRFLGIRYQFSNLGVQAELGFGTNGILNVGVAYEF